MKNNSIRNHILWLVGILILQILVINKMSVLLNTNIIIPLYIIPILWLPIYTNKFLVLLYVLVLGFIMDIFCITPGLHSFIMVFIGYIRIYVLSLLASKEKTSRKSPSIKLLGLSLFVIYATIFYLIYFILFTLLEYFQISSLFYMIKTIFLNTIINVFILLGIEYIKIEK